MEKGLETELEQKYIFRKYNMCFEGLSTWIQNEKSGINVLYLFHRKGD